jgi:2-keto-4-pentenoate hydratase
MSELPLDRILSAWEGAQPAPQDLHGKVSMADAYAMQLQVLSRTVAAGHQHSGWKLGQTNTQLRADRGEHEPAPGFMLAHKQRASGSRLDIEGSEAWYLEPELALILRSDLRGATVTANDVRDAVGGIASAFEVVRKRVGWDDRALQRAVNGSTAGYALGATTPGCPSAAELDDLRIVCSCDDKTIAALRGGDANDNPLQSTAWLARFLAGHGAGLQAGQVILTGTYAGLLPVRAGERWSTKIGDLAAVELLVE